MNLTKKQKKNLLTKAQRQKKLVATVATGMMLGNVLLGPVNALAEASNPVPESQIQEGQDQTQEKEALLSEVMKEQEVDEQESENTVVTEVASDVLSDDQQAVESSVVETGIGDSTVSWNLLSKTLELTVNQSDVNDVAAKIKAEYGGAVGNIETLVLHGSFDSTPLSVTNQALFNCQKVVGDASNIAPKMFAGATKLISVVLPEVSEFTGDEFNLVSTIQEVEVGMKDTDGYVGNSSDII